MPRPLDLRALEADVARETVRAALFGDAVPKQLGRYRIVRRLGRGAMGAVFDAHDPALDRLVALKLVAMRPDDRSLAQLEKRILREARAMARLHHPAAATVYEVGRHEGGVFLAMERVAGPSVRQWVTVEAPSWRTIVRAFVGVGQGLAAAHRAGLAHGDLKPDNLRFDEDGRLRILDFGLARSLCEVSLPSPGLSVEAPVALLRSVGLADHGGTPAYAAPERLEGAAADEASDQFSFFVSLYETLVGRRPFSGRNGPELLEAMADPSTPWRAGLVGPARLVRAFARGLSPDPTRRFESMDQAVATLSAIASGRRRRALALAGTVIVSVAAGFAVARSVPAACESPEALAASVWAGVDGPLADQRPREVAEPRARAVEEALHDWVQRWARASHDACTSARQSREPALLAPAVSCLGRQGVAARHLVQRLARDGPEAWRSAGEAVHALPSPVDCDDDGSFAPAPSDLLHAVVVDEIRATLARARVDADTGGLGSAVDLVAGALERAEQTAFVPVTAEARMLLGKLLADSERPVEASSALAEAHADGIVSGQLAIALEAAIALIYVDGFQRGRPERGEHWAWIASRLLDAGVGSEGSSVSLVANEGALAVFRGDPELAEIKFDEALRREQARADPNPFTIDGLQHNRGLMALRRGDVTRALPILEATVERRRTLFDPGHPKVALSLTSLAAAERDSGRIEEALAHDLEALAAVESQSGPESPKLRVPLMGLLQTQVAAGDVPAALRSAQRLQQLLHEHFGPDHPALSEVGQQVARAHARDCEPERADAELAAAIERVRRSGEPAWLLEELRRDQEDLRSGLAIAGCPRSSLTADRPPSSGR